MRPFFICGEDAKKTLMRQDVRQLTGLIEPVVNRMGFELWGIEYRPQTASALLRVYIDKPEGITLDDCGDVSAQLSSLLDVEDCIVTQYTLEVSSPGMDRLLMKPEHYLTYRGSRVRVKLNQMVDGRRKLVGKLIDSDGQTVTIAEQDDESIRVPAAAIDSARLEPEF